MSDAVTTAMTANIIGFWAVLATVAVVVGAILFSYDLTPASRTIWSGRSLRLLWLLRHQRQHKQGPWGPRDAGGAWGHW